MYRLPGLYRTLNPWRTEVFFNLGTQAPSAPWRYQRRARRPLSKKLSGLPELVRLNAQHSGPARLAEWAEIGVRNTCLLTTLLAPACPLSQDSLGRFARGTIAAKRIPQ